MNTLRVFQRTARLGVALVIAVGASLLSGPAPAWPAPSKPSGNGPLAVIFDLSGSMNEDDGTGTVKLDGAKESLVSVVKTQADRGQPVGLWTYPSGSTVGGCPAGSWVTPIGYQNPESISATINALTAGGETPTGPALRAAADQLKADGHVPAVILLVSDGLSNCGPPPCDVAKQLVSEGFDITVQAMGFQIEAEGRDELTCVAEATSGSYYDVSDTEDLREKIEEHGLPNLELKVDAPSSVSSGDIATITATVANTSAQAIANVDFAVVPLDSGSKTVLPAIIPPRVLVGNVPGDESRAYSWQVPVGSISKGGAAKFRAIATSNGYIGATSHDFTITALGPGAGILPETWLSKTVADGSKARIAVLGDSYSSGAGAGTSEADTDAKGSNECLRSSNTYLAESGLDVVNVACSGAVTANVISTNQGDQPPQIANTSLTSVDQPIDVAFLTIGGNDVRLGDMLTSCLIGRQSGDSDTHCADGMATAFGWASGMKPMLKEAYRQVYAAINAPKLVEARDGRLAPLVVLPYPDLVPTKRTGDCGLADSDLKAARRLIGELNAAAEDALEELGEEKDSDGTRYEGILFAGSVRSALGSHGICTEDPHTHNPTLKDASPGQSQPKWERGNLGHPNAEGYGDITQAIQAWSHTQSIDPATNVPTPEKSQQLVQARNPNTVSIDAASTSFVRQGDNVRVTASGLSPDSPVVLGAESGRYALGTARADADGNLDTVVGIPGCVPPGEHNLLVEGFDPDMRPVAHSYPLRVGRVAPWWVVAGPIVAGASLAAGLILLLVALAFRPRNQDGRGAVEPPSTS